MIDGDTIGIVLAALCFGDVPMVNMAKVSILCCFNKTLCLSKTVKGTKIGERAFRFALDFLRCIQCLTVDSQIFEHHDFASRVC